MCPRLNARWCSGSTGDFESPDPGSNPGRAATYGHIARASSLDEALLLGIVPLAVKPPLFRTGQPSSSGHKDMLRKSGNEDRSSIVFSYFSSAYF